MNDRHAVFARLTDGSTVRVSPWRASHGAAGALWELFDDVRIATNRRTDGWTNVSYFAVRADDDPNWNGAEYAPSRVQATVGKGAGHYNEKAVLRRIGQKLGLEGRQGGWVYRYRNGRAETVAQGWRSFEDEWTRTGRFVTREVDGQRRYFENQYLLDVGQGSNDPKVRA